MSNFVRRFLKNENGNVLIMMGLLAAPIMIMVGGVLDMHRSTSVQGTMQTAADAAVIAAFQNPKLRWRQRQRVAQQMFMANMSRLGATSSIKSKLRGKRVPSGYRMEFEAKTKLNGLFGDYSPFTNQNIKVKASAELRYVPNAHPRLVPNNDTESSLNR